MHVASWPSSAELVVAKKVASDFLQEAYMVKVTLTFQK